MADELRKERMEKAEQEAKREALAHEQAAKDQVKRLATENERTTELRPLFHQFHGYKIQNGNVGLAACTEVDGQGRSRECLKIDTVGTTGFSLDDLGIEVLSAQFVDGEYRLEVFRSDTKPAMQLFAGKFTKANDLMTHLAKKLSEM